MEQNNNTHKQTPARRNRGGGNKKGRKAYASEGDALIEMPTPASFPATPMKSNNGSPAPGSQPANPKSTTKKNRKQRPNNVSTSPGPAKTSQRTPPPSASATISAAAFASSSSFHSPAPGTLPRPAFSKITSTKSQTFASSDGQTLVRARSESVVVQTTKEPSPPASDCESPSPAQPTALAQNEAHDSPLEFLFQAKRAEKERIRRANSANASADLDGPFSAPPGSRHPQNLGLDDNPIPLKFPSRPLQRGISDNTGHAGHAMRPAAFAMPIHERIQAAGPNGSRMQQPHFQPVQNQQGQYHQHLATPPQLDKSEQMKRLLGISGPPSKSAPVLQSTAQQAQSHTSTTAFPNHASPSNSHATRVPAKGLSPNAGADRRVDLENSLRQALKLPWSISSGLDSNSSPQSQTSHFPGRG